MISSAIYVNTHRDILIHEQFHAFFYRRFNLFKQLMISYAIIVDFLCYTHRETIKSLKISCRLFLH